MSIVREIPETILSSC